MPRAEGRPRREPLRDVENLLIEYVLVGREWETYKCSCCDQPFKGSGGAFDRKTGQMLSLQEFVKRANEPDVGSGYGARVADAVRVVDGEDWEYKVGEWNGYACPACADKINRAWDVMPDA